MSGSAGFVLVLAGVGIALAGCGADEGSGDARPARPAQTVTIRETEFSLEPADVRLDSAGTFTFRAVNDGLADHALEIEGGGVAEETKTVAAGESAELTVQLAEGTYELYCPVGNHKEQGMVGRVVVGAGAGTTTTTGETETEQDEGYGY
ncbi:MAG: cupredoxin domain-containing protein [Actinomycetota bacterium]|nr:cupredoxin domain-containing protein [Actinomycetota bacterium]